jgi:hypothetical protein
LFVALDEDSLTRSNDIHDETGCGDGIVMALYFWGNHTMNENNKQNVGR